MKTILLHNKMFIKIIHSFKCDYYIIYRSYYLTMWQNIYIVTITEIND